MKVSIASVLLKAVGTAALALGFVALVGRVPFMPQSPAGSAASESPRSMNDRPLARLAVGEFSGTLPLVDPDAPVAVTGDMDKALGLFRGEFAATDASPGFATAEHPVPGRCEGAGRRYIERECPGCQVIADRSAAFSPSMLLWMAPASSAVQAVSTDCIAVGADGVPVVGTLVMSDPALDLTDEGSSLAGDVVPLLPGAVRVAAIEMGDWLAVFDQVARPSTALSDMATALRDKGWRETGDPQAGGLPAFAGERVFTKNAEVFCVISLSEQGGSYQLLTVVSSGARG